MPVRVSLYLVQFIAMPFAVSGGSFWFAWNKFCDDKEIEDMMKGVEARHATQ